MIAFFPKNACPGFMSTDRGIIPASCGPLQPYSGYSMICRQDRFMESEIARRHTRRFADSRPCPGCLFC